MSDKSFPNKGCVDSEDRATHTHGSGNCSTIQGCSCASGHEHNHGELSIKRIFLSAILLIIGLVMENTTLKEVVPNFVLILIYIVGYIPVAYPVLREAVEAIIKERDFFNEFSLMGLATLGALAIEQYPEAIAVMLFYSVGEYFQGKAVGKATKNIQSLLDVRVDEALLVTADGVERVLTEEVEVGSRIQIRVGDKVPLDGVLLSERGSFNTVALTGESVPQTKRGREQVLAGMINLDGVVEIETTETYNNTALSKILSLVQDATSRKSKTELLIRKIARVYTPIVFGLALALVFLPALFISNYVFSTWLYRALVFLVISCPCALVISIPLGYFAGIGAASRAGILFKGANYLDLMSKVNVVVMDKTGTMTEGTFEIQEVKCADDTDEKEFLSILSAVESFSSHPIAKAVLNYKEAEKSVVDQIKEIKEVAGYGVECSYQGQRVLVGNYKLLEKYNIEYDAALKDVVATTILMSVGDCYKGAVVIADRIKDDAIDAVRGFHNNGVKEVVMLSGDNPSITSEIGTKIGVDSAIGGLLPHGKVDYIKELKRDPNNVICFIGDGINDAPALAISDVGVAMGAMGADAAIEVADVVIQTDQPIKLNRAIEIARKTRSIVLQNIALAFGIKLAVLALGAFGIATMWQAVIADVGVTVLAITNAVRILAVKR